MYEENETMRLLGKQSIAVIPVGAKEQIYDVANYYNSKEVGLSELLRYGTDIFILGFKYGKGEVKNGIS